MREYLHRPQEDQSHPKRWGSAVGDTFGDEESMRMVDDDEGFQMAVKNPSKEKEAEFLKPDNVEGQTKFDEITINYDALFDKAWKDSWPNGPDKNVVEWGGILVKITVKTSDNKEKITYEILDLHHGSKGEIRKNDYTKVPESTDTKTIEILGDFHTHPYSKKEMRGAKRQKAEFDGNGDIFSSSDFISYSQLDEKYRGKGKMFIVVAGTVTYGVEILDTEKAKTLFERESFLHEIDYADSDFKDDGSSYPDKVFNKYQEILNTFGGQEEGGIKFYMKKDQ